MRDNSPKYALRKALVVTRTSTILDSVVEIDIGKRTDAFKGLTAPFNFPYLLTPSLYTLINAIPAMRQLRTVQLNNITLSRMYLRTILSSPHLIQLILNTVPLPKMSTFPPTQLRKLTLTMMFSWETVQPLIAHLATSLDYLELRWCGFLPSSQVQLPPFPCLRELRYHQSYTQSTFPDKGQLNELLRLASQVTHLHVTGHLHNVPITACQESLQSLSISTRMLSEHILGTKPFPQLVHLSLLLFGFADTADHRLTPSSFIRDHFPMIISFQLYVPWELRNHAMVIARSQRKVQALKLVINIREGMKEEEMTPYHPVEDPNEPLRCATLPAVLQILKLEVVQSHDELEQSATWCSRWVFDDVIPSLTGLGGTGLKSIGLSVSQQRRTSAGTERVLLRQWVKAPNDDWQRVE